MKNQFPLAPGVAGIDDIADVSALEKTFDQIEPRKGFFLRLEVEAVGDNREIGKTPLAALFIHLIRKAKLDEVTDRRRDHGVVTLKKIVFFGEFAERFGEVVGDGGLFCDDKSFRHGTLGNFYEMPAGSRANQLFHFKGEQSRRHNVNWQPATFD